MARERRRIVTANSSDARKASVWRRLRERLSLPGLEAWSTTVRTVFLNALFLVAIVVLLPVVVNQFRRDQVIIESIGVPQTLVDQGLTADIAASRIWDGLQDTVRKSRTAKESISAIPDARRVEFSFPDSGFSIESLVFHLRRLVNAYETRIAGEIVCADAKCERSGMRLRLRVVREGVELIDLPPIGNRAERDYFADAGARVLSILDPFVALAALSDTQPLRATILARRLIRAHHKDAKWALNLVGLIRLAEGDLPAAIEEFRAAIALDASFEQAHANLGEALLRQGDVKAAEAEFKGMRARDADSVWALQGLSEVALAKNDPQGAIDDLLKAAEIDPVNPLYYAKAGKIELDRGHKPEAMTLLAKSLELDPGYQVAFAFLAAIQLGDGDYEAAEKTYRDAADYAPDDAEAQAAHGNILAILHRWPQAVARYERATVVEPANVKYWLDYGRCLNSAGRNDESLKALVAAAAIEPLNADVQMSMGDTLRDGGRKQEAVAAYKKFLDLDKSGSPMRTVAQRFIELLSA